MAEVVQEIERHAKELTKNCHPQLGPATINVGRISGGEAVNIVPPQCRIDIDRRLLPNETLESAMTVLRTRLRRFGDKVVMHPPYVEAAGMHNDLVSLPCSSLLAACDKAGWSPKFKTAHYTTDASILTKAGIATAVFGPGSVSLAHTKAEYVPINEIETAAEIITMLLTED